MKRIVIALILIFVSNAVWSQTVFDKLENRQEVTSLIVNKKMLSLLGNMEAKDKDSQEYVDLIKRMDNLRVYVTQDKKSANEMKTISDKYIKSSSLEELLREIEDGKTINVYVKPGMTNSKIKEMLMFVDGKENEETVLMVLTGNFDLEEVYMLTDKMNLPGGKDLKKASKTAK